MRKFLLKILFFTLPFVIMAIILLMLPYNKKFAYTTIENSCYDRGAFIYSRIFEDTASIDVAFVGTSHTMCAINDSLLTNQSSGLQYANISFCWQGINTEYVILKDLLKNKSPKFVVFEVREREENISNKIFPYIADAEDIIQQPYFQNATAWNNFFDAVFTRVEAAKNRKPILISTQKRDKQFGYEPRGEFADSAELISMQKNQIINYDTKNGRYRNDTFSGYALYYFEKMMQLCAEYNVQPYFLYLPNYGDILQKPINAAVYEQYGKIITPSAYLMKYYEHWSDGAHLNEKGAYHITQYLAPIFEKEFNTTTAAQ